MNALAQIWRAWGPEMTGADRLRVCLAPGFIFGALSHIWWVFHYGKGDLWYHGPGPAWAPWFWYSLCVIDFIEAWLLLTRPRTGVALGFIVMVVSVWVNWTQFPLEVRPGQFNLVLYGLTAFGVLMWVAAPWLWLKARWKLSPSSARSGG
jgi:hypothetical protein